MFCKNILKFRLNIDFCHQYEKLLFKSFGNHGLFDDDISPINQGLISHEIESVDSGYRSAWSVQSSLVIYPIVKYGTDEQKEKYLDELKTGNKIGCFGLTEEDAGSDPSKIKTRVKEFGNTYILNGIKMWITNAPIADYFIIWAKNEMSELGGYIVHRDNPGLKVMNIENKMSLQMSPTGIIYLNNVIIDKNDKLNIKGFTGPFTCLNKARYGIGWGSLGAARDCLEQTIDYIDQRHQFGKSLSSFQLIQSEIADMVTEWILAHEGCHQIGSILENSKDPFSHENSVLISLMKRNSTIKSLDIARRCRDILGANGIITNNSIMRHMCNLESVITYEGTKSMHTLNIGRSITNNLYNII